MKKVMLKTNGEIVDILPDKIEQVIGAKTNWEALKNLSDDEMGLSRILCTPHFAGPTNSYGLSMSLPWIAQFSCIAFLGV